LRRIPILRKSEIAISRCCLECHPAKSLTPGIAVQGSFNAEPVFYRFTGSKRFFNSFVKQQNRGFFNGQGGITTLPVKNAARSPLLSLNVGGKSTLLVSHDSDPRQRSNWTKKKISIVLIWSQIKDLHTDRFQLQFSVKENTVSKSYAGTFKDLKNRSKIHDRIWFFWISLVWASYPAVEPAFIWSR